MAEITEILVAGLMKPARTIPKETSIRDALRIMKSENTGLLSIVDEKNILIGAVTVYNFMKLVKHEPASPVGDPVWFDSIDPDAGGQPVEGIMTTNITTVKRDDNIGVVLRVMNATGYKLLHVVDSDGRLLGVVRMGDIFENLLGA